MAIALLTLLSFGLVGVVCQRVAARGRFAAAYSTYGSGPTGTRGVYTLLSELGVTTQRWSEDLAAMPAGGMLVALGGCDSELARPLSRYEQDELDRWIGGGGTLLIAGARDYLPSGFGLGFDADGSCTDPEHEEYNDESDVVWTAPLAAPLMGLDLIPLTTPGTLATDLPTHHTPLLGVSDFVHATVMERGRGHVIWFASASLFQNRHMLHGDGAVVLMRLVHAYAPKGPVRFDEYHLGVGEKRSLMTYLRHAGVWPVALQLVIGVLLLLWRGGARFGGVSLPNTEPPAGTTSYVMSMASLMQRAKDPRGTVQILLHQGLRVVANAHGVSVPRDDQEGPHIAAALRATGQDNAAQHVERMIAAAQSVNSHEKSLRNAAQTIDDATRHAITRIHSPEPRDR